MAGAAAINSIHGTARKTEIQPGMIFLSMSECHFDLTTIRGACFVPNRKEGLVTGDR
jgi:hypothetical protein